MMRRIAGVAALVALFCAAGGTTSDAGEARFGLLWGVDFSRLKVDARDAHRIHDVRQPLLGGLFEWRFQGGRMIQPSLRVMPMYVNRRERRYYNATNREGEEQEFRGLTRVEGLEIPLSLRFGTSRGNFRPYLSLGHTIGIVTTASTSFGALGSGRDNDFERTLRSPYFALNTAAGFDFPLGKRIAFVELRYQRMLSNLTADPFSGIEAYLPETEGLQIISGILIPLTSPSRRGRRGTSVGRNRWIERASGSRYADFPIRVGALAGVHLADFESAQRSGGHPTVGLLLELRSRPSRPVDIALFTELTLVRRSARFARGDGPFVLHGLGGEIAWTHLEVPIGFKIAPNVGWPRPFIQFGARTGILLDARAEHNLEGTGIINPPSGDVTDGFSRSYVDGTVGGRFEIRWGSRLILIQSRYQLALRSLDNDESASTTNRGVEILVGVSLPLRA